MTRIIINGSKGRMGQALLACAKQHVGLEVVAGIDVGDDLAALLPGADAVIDFTHHDATPALPGTPAYRLRCGQSGGIGPSPAGSPFVGCRPTIG